MLRTQLFIVLGLVDAVPMIAVGIGLYVDLRARRLGELKQTNTRAFRL